MQHSVSELRLTTAISCELAYGRNKRSQLRREKRENTHMYEVLMKYATALDRPPEATYVLSKPPHRTRQGSQERKHNNKNDENTAGNTLGHVRVCACVRVEEGRWVSGRLAGAWKARVGRDGSSRTVFRVNL